MLDTEAGLVLVMEYIEGQALAQLIRNHGVLPIDEALWIFKQALHGVERAHAVDIVHRDLKPANIFITHDRRVKIMDFGLAKMQDQRHHSLSGATLGPLLYTPPAQVNGKDADLRSDIYTLGISLFEALTGRLPFQRNSDYAPMNAHLKEAPPNPRASPNHSAARRDGRSQGHRKRPGAALSKRARFSPRTARQRQTFRH